MDIPHTLFDSIVTLVLSLGVAVGIFVAGWIGYMVLGSGILSMHSAPECPACRQNRLTNYDFLGFSNRRQYRHYACDRCRACFKRSKKEGEWVTLRPCPGNIGMPVCSRFPNIGSSRGRDFSREDHHATCYVGQHSIYHSIHFGFSVLTVGIDPDHRLVQRGTEANPASYAETSRPPATTLPCVPGRQNVGIQPGIFGCKRVSILPVQPV